MRISPVSTDIPESVFRKTQQNYTVCQAVKTRKGSFGTHKGFRPDSSYLLSLFAASAIRESQRNVRCRFRDIQISNEARKYRSIRLSTLSREHPSECVILFYFEKSPINFFIPFKKITLNFVSIPLCMTLIFICKFHQM